MSLSSSLSPHHLFANSFALFFLFLSASRCVRKQLRHATEITKQTSTASISLTTTKELLLTDRQWLLKKTLGSVFIWLCTPYCFAPVTYLFNFPVLLIPLSLPLTSFYGPFAVVSIANKTTKQLGPCPQLNPPSDAQNNTNQTIDARPRSVRSYLFLIFIFISFLPSTVACTLPPAFTLYFSHSSFFLQHNNGTRQLTFLFFPFPGPGHPACLQ